MLLAFDTLKIISLRCLERIEQFVGNAIRSFAGSKYHAVKATNSGARSAKISHPNFMKKRVLPGGGTLRCTAVHTQSNIVMRHVLRMSYVPRALQLGCQWTISEPLPNKFEVILCFLRRETMSRWHFQSAVFPDCRGRDKTDAGSKSMPRHRELLVGVLYWHRHI